MAARNKQVAVTQVLALPGDLWQVMIPLCIFPALYNELTVTEPSHRVVVRFKQVHMCEHVAACL